MVQYKEKLEEFHYNTEKTLAVIVRMMPRILMPNQIQDGKHLAECGAAVMDAKSGTIMPTAPIMQQVILFCIL